MTCSICSSPSTADICPSCASRVEHCPPGTAMVQKKSARKQWYLTRAGEGDKGAITHCVKQGWMKDPNAPEEVEDWRRDPESIAERRMEAFAGARAAGCSMDSAMDAWNGIR